MMDVDPAPRAAAGNSALNLNIIRIKRKATEAPLTSLVVQEGERASKRHRENTAPSGPLSPGGTGGNTGHGIFRLVQTVGHGWSAKANEEAALRQRIQDLIAEQKAQVQSITSPLTNPTEDIDLSTSLKSPGMASEHGTDSPTVESIPVERRFRVIKPAVSQSRKLGSRFGAKAAVAVNKTRQDFRLIDAQLESSLPTPPPAPAPEPLRQRAPSPKPPTLREAADDDLPTRMPGNPVSRPAPKKVDDEEMDLDMKEMEKFLPMLTESLGISDRSEIAAGPSRQRQPAKPLNVASRTVPPSLPSSQISIRSNAQTDDDGDWVYDLYYREPTELPRGALGVDAGMGPFGDGVMVGFLAGLDELLDDEEDPGSDTEEGDEADEDSNEENFYRNEYPDEESPSPSSSPEMFTHMTMRAQAARNVRAPNGKQPWGQYEANEYYGDAEGDQADDSEEEEKRMPDWKVGLTRLQRKLRGEERERDKMPLGLKNPAARSKGLGETDEDDDDNEDEDEDEDDLEDMSDFDD